MSRRALTMAGGCLAAAWPLIVLFLHEDVGNWPLLAIGIALLAWRLPGSLRVVFPLAVVLLGLGLVGRAEWGVRAYPVAVNAGMLMLFAASLMHGPPIVERLARLRTPTLPPHAIRYTRRVTQAWCLFFMINGGIAAGTVFAGDLAWWSLYNGAISYLLMAAMFAGEWVIRRYRIGKSV
ncbi:hypothetical protein ACFO0E_12870 [Chromohalobacter beijerinckii]|uniref:DNA gyrase subunit B n=1 Tax=Chromohalobacter beijerinckii TaxID=86179 RepID=A0ABV8XEH5_9GAMM|nr:hypothetical protein [Chromohalobacter beijerinckii]MCK0764929.1 hypothetical protein [Chromohalobacter beijerinckii]